MIRYTTPTHELTVRGADLMGCDVIVSYEQRGVEIDIPASSVAFDGEDSLVTVELTQEQTGSLRLGKIKVQVNWIDPSGRRDATEIKEVEVSQNLLGEVREYGG